jgi:hypothetical protein
MVLINSVITAYINNLKDVRPLNMGAYGMSIVLLMLYKKLYIYKPVETGVTG